MFLSILLDLSSSVLSLSFPFSSLLFHISFLLSVHSALLMLFLNDHIYHYNNLIVEEGNVDVVSVIIKCKGVMNVIQIMIIVL